MKAVLSLLLMVLLGACNKNIEPKELIGKWDNTYEIRTKDEAGEWTEWTTINTLVALPQLEFTEKGKILWDGKPSEACCTFTEFEVEGETITLSVPPITTGCELVNCALCDTWTIVKLTNKQLELNICDNSMLRYNKAN
ncbi:hypothetical protein [Arcticibacterium luteifluviistationis]|nr:hypothetical protein [Arcticibacterium luteifluviistationis]